MFILHTSRTRAATLSFSNTSLNLVVISVDQSRQSTQNLNKVFQKGTNLPPKSVFSHENVSTEGQKNRLLAPHRHLILINPNILYCGPFPNGNVPLQCLKPKSNSKYFYLVNTKAWITREQSSICVVLEVSAKTKPQSGKPLEGLIFFTYPVLNPLM